MGKIIVSTGRGGTGKSTFVALAARYLASPLLLLDIDPDQSLSDMLGVNLEKVETKTISDIVIDIADGAFAELGGGPQQAKIPFLLRNYTTYSSEKFDLISMGPMWALGDYRYANYLFKYIIPSYGGAYTNILVDSPSGLEHWNRRAIPNIDDLFLILDPSLKSIKHIERVRKITSEVGISYKHLYLVGNYEFDNEAEQHLQCTGETYLGKMDYDASVKDYNLKGKSLLNLPQSSPACLSVKKILAKAGYEIS